MYKVKCLNPISGAGMGLFSAEYKQVEDYEEADIVLVRSGDMHELGLPENLMAIARAGAGVNNIPIDACSEKGIVVFNTPGANANSVKELVVLGLILAARNIVEGINWVQCIKGDSDVCKLVEKGKKPFAGNELLGKKLGVIGLGAIGVRVANACNSLGMEVYGYDPYISVDGAWHLSRNIKHAKSIEEIYSVCDFITLHVPALEETKGMICRDTIEMMKEGIIILNFARDTLVNDDDMAEAIKSGRVRKYVTDFPNEKTANMEGVIAIPHLGASTEESEENCAIMAVKELIDFMENGNIKNSVNYPNCDMGHCTKEERVLINHENIPNMIGQFTAVFADQNVNISNMINKSKGNYAYTMFDLDGLVSDAVIGKLGAVKGVKRIRVIKNN